MGRIKNKIVKRASREIVEKFYGKLTEDFYLNKKVIEQVTDVQSKKIKNQIAGFTTRIYKKIQTKPVRGVSLKLQEEQREKRLDAIPVKTCLNIEEKSAVPSFLFNHLKGKSEFTNIIGFLEEKIIQKDNKNKNKE